MMKEKNLIGKLAWKGKKIAIDEHDLCEIEKS